MTIQEVAEKSPKYLIESENSVVSAGYKKTEVGVIPKDWIVEPLENFTSFISYGFTNPMPTTSSGPYMITARDIANGKIQYREARTTDIEAFNKLLTPKSKPKKDDLLLTKDGTLGRLALVDNQLICINQSVAILRPNNRIVPKFFKLLLEGPLYQERMLEDAGGSTIRHIYITIVNKMPLGLPANLEEQMAIANALSDVDALITELEKLITKKQAIKTATMQLLLTGRTRLPQFALREDGSKKGYKQSELGDIPEDWEICELNDAVDFLDGLRRPVKSGDRAKIRGIYPYYGASGIVDYVNDFIFDDELILLGEDGENILSRNLPLAFKVSGKIWVNNHAHVMKPKSDFDITYLTEFLESLDYSLLNSGTAQPKLNKQSCLKIKVAKPSKKEQSAIAIILSDMDDELRALEQRLNKNRQIKQGMMQELLTGKTRLVKPEDDHRGSA